MNVHSFFFCLPENTYFQVHKHIVFYHFDKLLAHACNEARFLCLVPHHTEIFSPLPDAFKFECINI